MKFRCKRTIAFSLLTISLILSLAGCVDQSQGSNATLQGQERIVATSTSVVEICDKLDLDLVGVPTSSIYKLPERYEKVTKVGTPMSPDMEVISTLGTDWVIGPKSLQSDLQPKFKEGKSEYAFVNLDSVWGMYKSIQELGELFDRAEQAEKLVNDFVTYYQSYQKKVKEKTRPSVLILMGLPGSYVVATEQSYVGSLVAMAGATNVCKEASKDFVTVNTEELAKMNPDIILRASHAMPEQVSAMFAEEFATNDIWKHFRAVKEEKVYDLPGGQFGMSANFNYQDALETLQKILYGEEST